MSSYGRYRRALFLLMMLVLALTGAGAATAQDAAVPIDVGEVLPGQVSAFNIAPSYLYNALRPQVLNVRVEAQGVEFVPAVRILNAAGQLVEDIPNPGNANVIEAIAQLPQEGPYLLQVFSATGAPGEFTIQITEALPVPDPLNIGDEVEVELGLEADAFAYVFDAAADLPLWLSIESDEPLPEAVVSLVDEAGEEVARIDLRLGAAQLRIPPGTGRYVLLVFHEGLLEPTMLRVALVPPEEAVAVPTPTLMPTRLAIEPLPATGPCVVAPEFGGVVNLRQGPGTNYPVGAQLVGNATAQVMGVLPDGTWFLVSYQGNTYWVAEFVVRRGGECVAIPVVQAPAAVVTPTVTPIAGVLPDLAVGGVSVTPNTPTVNSQFAINVTVNNQSNTPVTNVPVRLNFQSPSPQISLPTSDLVIPFIQGNSAVTVNFVGLSANAAGQVSARVTVDPNNTIPEPNETNNTQVIEFPVVQTPPNLPDLTIEAVDVDTTAGGTQARIRVTVRNRGTAQAQPFRVRLNFDPAVIGAQILEFPALGANETRRQAITVNLNQYGNYSVTAIADPNQIINELNEDNNRATENFTLVQPSPTPVPPTPEGTPESTPESTPEATPEGAQS